MKSLRDFVNGLKERGELKVIEPTLKKELEMAGVFEAFQPTPVLAHAEDSGVRCVSNIFATKERVAEYLGCGVGELGKKMVHAINNPSAPAKAATGPVLEETLTSLEEIPVPLHTEKDGGPYICSGIVVAKDPEYGQNCSFHRMMVLDGERLVLRILPRHLDKFLERAGGELDVAVIVGAPINVLLSSAISSELGQNELEIANTLMPFETVELMNGIEIPADVEFAFLGKINANELEKEGPFVDLTNTYDIVRKQPVMRVSKIYHRSSPVFHALLPGGMEHKVLMGMPREPTIFNKVNESVECVGVNITQGGCSWLHAAVSIRKKGEEDGKRAIEAAFEGHKSLKHVVVVDEDIDVNDASEVEWAIATRFQASKDLAVKEGEKGSSLDPSAK
ncbi:UbiD family decarboxylase, partial [Candidatus Micrarchaeota archaeon]|nr:UbiD family decarboxylase [Candidatus Micrarchaeota archaeon]MBD3418137.1 UbiD family decarboxylase [Candidatus Micrarchaeota archaeon]